MIALLTLFLLKLDGGFLHILFLDLRAYKSFYNVDQCDKICVKFRLFGMIWKIYPSLGTYFILGKTFANFVCGWANFQ